MARAFVYCATENCDAFMTCVGNNRNDANYRAKKLTERGWLCRGCDNREVAARADASGLPKLEGTEKQVAWAMTLREKVAAYVEKGMPEALSIKNPSSKSQHYSFVHYYLGLAILIEAEGEEAVREASTAMLAETDAKFWIDNRDEDIPTRIAAVIERLAEEEEAMTPESKAAAAAEQEAMAEATLRPAEPVSHTIAELSFRDGRFAARYEERSDTFNETVKRLGFTWDPPSTAWVRRHQPAMMGAPSDRLAETAHELLAAGIVVMVHDPEVRAKAIERSYEPEHRRWVSMVQGSSPAKLRLWWGRDDDFYQAFKSLPASTYTMKQCLLPATSRDELLDFAEAHGFQFTPGAQAQMDEVMAQRERGIVVNAKAAPKADPVKSKARGSSPDRLSVPESVEVASDLVDND